MHTIPADKIIVVTHVDHAGEIKRQLDQAAIKGVRILAEPEARNTAPAIGLAAWYLHHEAGPEAVMAVLPSDHLIPDHDQFAALLEDGEKAAITYGLVTFGIRPAYPETGYGYICCGEELAPKTFRVEKFVEKPDLKTAEQYLADSRYLWNSGMFVYRVGALIDEYRTHLPEMYAALGRIDYHKLGNLATVYSTLEKISVDYGILERAAGVTVIPTTIGWSDLGSWEAYHQVAEHDPDGNFTRGRVIAIETKDSLIYSTSRLVGTAGVKDLVIVDTADALLVCDRHSSQDVKRIVDELKATNAVEAREHRTIYRPWGSYTSLEMGPTYQVKRINVNPGARLSLQSHNHRAENWVVVEGEALVTIDDSQVVVKRGESVIIPKGARHRMENRHKAPLAIIEVQNGDYLGEDDIVRYEDDYGRTEENAAPSADQLRGEGWVGSQPIHGSTGLQSRPSTLPEDLSTKPKSVQAYRQPGQEAKTSASSSMPSSKASEGTEGKEIHDDASEQDSKSPSPLGGEGRGEGAAPLNQQFATSVKAQARLNRWLAYPELNPGMREEIEALQADPAAVESHFGSELVFGTGGMRGIIGPGLNRINRYTIRRATQGLANYLNSRSNASGSSKPPCVAIAHDTRRYSPEFTRDAAAVLAANGIKVMLFSDIRPTPMLSYTTRVLGCAAGIVITASHNPPAYNGYKVYGPDGGQAVSPLVDDLIEAIKNVDIFEDVKAISEEEAIARGLLETIDPALDQAYLEQVSALSLNDPQTCLKVVYTPLHGTGMVYIPNLLTGARCVDLSLVEEQMQPDPNFSTVRVPNPEDPAALEMALKLAARVEADLILATDPDGDRVGTAIRNRSGSYEILSGNQVGALLIEYICSSLAAKGALPADPVMVKTIVTGELGCRVAASYGLQVVETLTGFKFIGDKIKEFEAAGGPNFIFGYEESCGYLTGTFVRDKDAVISSFLIAEMTAYYKEQGKTLLDVLAEIQQKHGFFAEDLLTIELKDISEADRHVAAYHDLPPQFAGRTLAEKRDYGQSIGMHLPAGDQFRLDLPKSQVLHYTLDDGSWFAVRPSGTEPKVKFYLSVCAKTAEEAKQKLATLREAVLGRA
jgi:phosphoglucomutase